MLPTGKRQVAGITEVREGITRREDDHRVQIQKVVGFSGPSSRLIATTAAPFLRLLEGELFQFVATNRTVLLMRRQALFEIPACTLVEVFIDCHRAGEEVSVEMIQETDTPLEQLGQYVTPGPLSFAANGPTVLGAFLANPTVNPIGNEAFNVIMEASLIVGAPVVTIEGQITSFPTTIVPMLGPTPITTFARLIVPGPHWPGSTRARISMVLGESFTLTSLARMWPSRAPSCGPWTRPALAAQLGVFDIYTEGRAEMSAGR